MNFKYTNKIDDIWNGIINKDHACIGKGISLIENTNPKNYHYQLKILKLAIDRIKEKNMSSLVIGVTGTPGAGKSTFIDTLGDNIIKKDNKRIAVLAIDPSSPITKGSIMGDKIRMNKLLNHKKAYIRGTNNKDSFLSIGIKVYDIILLLIVADFDIIFIETVGVGQSEHIIASFTDILFLILQPIEGDEIQTIKKGITELSDFILINKCDEKISNKIKSNYSKILNKEESFIFNISSKYNKGIIEFWDNLENKYLNSNNINKYIEKDVKINLWLEQIISLILFKKFISNNENKIKFDIFKKLLKEKNQSITEIINNINISKF